MAALHPTRRAALMRTAPPALALLTALLAQAAHAQSAGGPSIPAAPGPSTPGPTTAPVASPAPVASNDITKRSNLFGDMFGLRPALAKLGITFTATEVSEVLGNVTGGIHRNADYEGLTTAGLQLDTDTAFGWKGGTFNISAEQIHGRNFSADTLLNLNTASGIESDRATRLWELWYDQKLGDIADIKVGQQSLDQEFMVSSNALLFVNTMFGWPLIPSDDLPGGGPAYPLSSLGIRAKVQPLPGITLLGGVFNGSPTPRGCTGDPQLCDGSGTNFSLDGQQLIIGEIQLDTPADNDLVTPDAPGLLAGTYKLGFWVDTENFADQRYDTNGVSLASALTNGVPYGYKNNWSIYGVMDQQIWRPGDKIISAFVRAMGAPADRNLVNLSVNAGFTVKTPFEGRDSDTFGIAYGYGQIGNFARGLDRDVQAQDGGFARSNESFVEATYQYQVFPWWQLQPDLQYTFNPGAGIANPLQPTQKIKNEAVFGLRTNIVF